jgi:hypothetical protein
VILKLDLEDRIVDVNRQRTKSMNKQKLRFY